MRDEFLNIGNIINVFKLIPKRKGKLKVKKKEKPQHHTICKFLNVMYTHSTININTFT